MERLEDEVEELGNQIIPPPKNSAKNS